MKSRSQVCLHAPDIGDFVQAHQQLDSFRRPFFSRLPSLLSETDVKRSCAQLGQPGRATLIREGCEEGFLAPRFGVNRMIASGV